MVDIYRIAKQRGKYPPRLTDTEVSSCYRIKISDITRKKKMILTHLFLQLLQYFRAQIPHALLGEK